MASTFASALAPLDVTALWQLVNCPFSVVEAAPLEAPTAPVALVEDVAVLYEHKLRGLPAMKPKKPATGTIRVRRKH